MVSLTGRSRISSPQIQRHCRIHAFSFSAETEMRCLHWFSVFILSITVIFHADMRFSVQSVEEAGRPRQEPKIQASPWCQERADSEAAAQDVGVQEDVFP